MCETSQPPIILAQLGDEDDTGLVNELAFYSGLPDVTNETSH